jgi:hypothetical protein
MNSYAGKSATDGSIFNYNPAPERVRLVHELTEQSPPDLLSKAPDPVQQAQPFALQAVQTGFSSGRQTRVSLLQIPVEFFKAAGGALVGPR